MRPNSAGSLLIDLLGTADQRDRGRESVTGRIPFCFQDELTLKWFLPSAPCRQTRWLPQPLLSRPWRGTRTWLCGWVILERRVPSKKQNRPPPPRHPLSRHPLPPTDSCLWHAGLVLCSSGPVCAGKAVKMSTNQSFGEKQWALEGRYPVTKHTPFMECWC